MLERNRFMVYGGTGHHDFDVQVLTLVNQVMNLGLKFDHIWHTNFPDEPGFRLEKHELIKDRHVLVFTCPITDKLENELRDIVTGCRQQYEAQSVTVVMAFMRYRRQDRSEKIGEITRLRWFIRELKHWGVDRLVVCEPHSVRNTQKHCDEFGIRLHVADPTPLFVKAVSPLVQTLRPENVCFYSPDFGSVGRALKMAEVLGCSLCATPKIRLNGRVETVEQADFIQRIVDTFHPKICVSCSPTEIAGKHVFIREDEASTCTTATLTATGLRQAGAASVRLLASHPVCVPGWQLKLFPEGEMFPFDGIWFGNTRPRGQGTKYEETSGNRVVTVGMEPVVAETLAEVVKDIED